ncbi:8178_t:CDS:2 [Funneliformis geosporum]|nr:8178_t:CDS:2 [Funneliformis geosporum]
MSNQWTPPLRTEWTLDKDNNKIFNNLERRSRPIILRANGALIMVATPSDALCYLYEINLSFSKKKGTKKNRENYLRQSTLPGKPQTRKISSTLHLMYQLQPTGNTREKCAEVSRERQIPSFSGPVWECDFRTGEVGVWKLLRNECLDMEFFGKEYGITPIHPLLVDHSRSVLLFLDDHSIMFMWSESENICVVMKDTGELVSKVELKRREMEEFENKKLEKKKLAEKNREKRLAEEKGLRKSKSDLDVSL